MSPFVIFMIAPNLISMILSVETQYYIIVYDFFILTGYLLGLLAIYYDTN